MPQSKLDPEQVEAVRTILELREEAGTKGLVLNERVDVRLDGPGNGPFVVTKRDFRFAVDEPPERAGRDTAPNPLAFFVAGAATCYLSHFMMQVISREIEIDDLRMTARGRFDRRAIGGHLTKLSYDLRVESATGQEAIAQAAARAEKMCYAHNTLVMAGVDVTTNVALNGQKVTRLVADTSHLD